ncbi:bifunctional folylpolyglutamate synthase/dihydrofolate synthase [Deferribacter desulfuricans]|uniref:bifunctional folylpolyglutamate synthase/dihydrofolate synthase n=1 Tax=Deferribacter desulfuricans TaxID=197162 RepID=UPI0009FC825D
MEKHYIQIVGVFWLITAFEKFFQNISEYKSIDLTLNRINFALRDLGFNEKKLGTIIHIAGTNGKGTTAHTLYQILINNGYNVALYTSPHLKNITERIIYNSKQIDIDTFNNYFYDLLSFIKKYNLTYFEALTLIALIYFSELSPDFSIIETGMGGKFDATNILNNKIPVITTIALDHEQFLGSRLEDIANEKIAIIKNNEKVFLGHNNSKILDLIKNNFPTIDIITPDENTYNLYKKYFPNPYYKNISLVCLIVNYLNLKYDISSISLPNCRFEKYKNFIFDGAHNFNGIVELLKNFKEKITILYSCTKDRNFTKIINYMVNKKNIVIVTEMNNERTLVINEVRIEHKNLFKIKNKKDALRKAIELSKNNDILVCGSLFFCQEIKDIVKEV